jgi:YD repeat-containing protein
MEIKPPFFKPVKECSMESYVFDEDGREVLDHKITWKYFNDNQISEVVNFDSNNELVDTSFYTYDRKQNLLEITVENADESLKQSTAYEYKENKLFRSTETSADYKIVTTFDDYGYLIEKQNLGIEDEPFSTTKYINLYDQNGRLIEKHTVFPSGDKDWIDKYEYNSQGLLIVEQRIRGQITSLTRHFYNDRGDLLLSEYNPGQPNNETLKREIVYDANNDISEIKEYRKGWCYQDRGGEFGLTVTLKYSYVR